jgi:26S proteasome regulatory subunit N2
MMKDSVDFVRQGAFVAVSMVMIQVNEAQNPKVASIRKQLQKAVSDRHEDAMAKFGAGLALGIIDAGGRNATIGLQTPTGNLNMAAIVGMAIFTQYWYWFPLTHFLALSFTPTAIIGVDSNLDVPSFKFHSNTRPSMFDYPPEHEVKTEEAPEKVKTAVLSTTAQAKRRKIAKDRQNRRESMDIDQPTTPKPEADSGDKMDEDNVIDTSKLDDKEKESSPKAKLQKEKVGYELENMSRVLPSQVRWISFPSEGRYQPVKKVSINHVLPLQIHYINANENTAHRRCHPPRRHHSQRREIPSRAQGPQKDYRFCSHARPTARRRRPQRLRVSHVRLRTRHTWWLRRWLWCRRRRRRS